MTLKQVLDYFHKVKGSGNQYSALCPAHDDKNQSLSISQGEGGKVLLHCHAGCTNDAILAAVGLKTSDLFNDAPTPPKTVKASRVADYEYMDVTGQVTLRKTRMSDKQFFWSHMAPNGWRSGRNGAIPALYNQAVIATKPSIYIVEGEKDVDTMKAEGFAAVSGADGAGKGKEWRVEWTQALKGKNIAIIPDHDEAGRAYAEITAKALHGTAASVRIIDLSKLWPEIPKGGDITDLRQAKGSDALGVLTTLIKDTHEWAPVTECQKNPTASNCFMRLDEVIEQEAKWIIPQWIPENQITLLAGDGGVGKTTVWCHIVAALSSGKACMLDPPGHTREPMKIVVLTTEDSVSMKLKRKLMMAGANDQNIYALNLAGDTGGQLRDLKFGSQLMEDTIKQFKPAFFVFDPVQGFVPPGVNMGSRNAMRDCTQPLISLGERYDCTFLIVCHTNKRKGAYGRDRIADSADLWDGARSVIMAGKTENVGVCYLSLEKHNYTESQRTILYSINNEGQVKHTGTTWKHDREYMLEATMVRTPVKREDCKEFVLQILAEVGGRMDTETLRQKASDNDYSYSTLRAAKDDLKADGKIVYKSIGNGKSNKTWFTCLVKNTTPSEILDSS